MHLNTEIKPKLLWLQGVTCNGNSHSFLNLESLEQLLDKFELLYHPLLASTYSLCEIVSLQMSCDILIFEGTYDPEFQRNNIALKELIPYYALQSKHIIALGTCASFGGMFQSLAPERNSGLIYQGEDEDGPLLEQKKKVINLSGCPVHPEWLATTLQMLLDEYKIALDDLQRPRELYSSLAHHGCTRNEYFEWKVDTKGFGLKEGCLFYENGCRAPLTHASCNTILWNEVSSKTRVGTPCFGCTEPSFPRTNYFQTKTNMSIPQDVPLGISKRAYLTVAGMAKTFHIKRLEGVLIDYKRDY